MANIRLWNLGKMDGHSSDWVIPTKDTVNKLKNLLSDAKGSGTVDLIWTPDLKCTIISEDGIDKILVPEKLEDGRVLYRLEDI